MPSADTIFTILFAIVSAIFVWFAKKFSEQDAKIANLEKQNIHHEVILTEVTKIGKVVGGLVKDITEIQAESLAEEKYQNKLRENGHN